MTNASRFDLPLRQVAEVVAAAGIAALLTIAYIVYAGRVLGPEEYADFAASLSIVYFASLALSPLGPAVARLCARFAARGDDQAVASLRRRIMIRAAAASGAVAIAGVAASPVLAHALRFRSPVTLAFVFAAILVFTLLSVDRGAVQGLLVFRVHNLNTVIEAAARWVAAIAIFTAWRSAAGAMGSYLVAMLVAELMLAVYLRREHTAAGAEVDWNEVRRVTLPLVVLMFAVAAQQNADMLIIKHFFPAPASGAYGAATALARAIGIVFVPLYVMVSPILAGLHEAGRAVFSTTLRYGGLFLALAAGPLVLMIVWPDLIVTLLYGRAFAAAAPLLAPLAGVAVVLYASLMLSQALITVGKNGFLVAYVAVTIGEIAGLWLFHATFRAVFVVLYASQAAVFVFVAIWFLAAWRSHRT